MTAATVVVGVPTYRRPDDLVELLPLLLAYRGRLAWVLGAYVLVYCKALGHVEFPDMSALDNGLSSSASPGLPAWLADTGQDFSKAAAMAKLHASEVANRVASASLQIHGGYGYMRESEISRFYSDAKILEIGEGTSEIQRNIIAKMVLGGR